MKTLQNLKIKGSRDRNIVLDVLYPSTQQPKPLVIFCHGFKGFKDWGHFNLIASTIAKAGYVVSKFNFSYNGGTDETVIDFPDLEAFGQNNFSTELNDLGLFIDTWQTSNQFISDEEVDRDHIILIGHSRGGGTSILKAGEDPRIKQLVSLAAVNNFGKLFESDSFVKNWKKEGVIYIPNGRTHQQMPMYYQCVEDYTAHKDRLDILAAAARVSIPWLIVHGESDAVVPIAAAKEMHSINKQSKLLIIENGDHTFGGKHPWGNEKLPSQTQIWVNQMLAFIKK